MRSSNEAVPNQLSIKSLAIKALRQSKAEAVENRLRSSKCRQLVHPVQTANQLKSPSRTHKTQVPRPSFPYESYCPRYWRGCFSCDHYLPTNSEEAKASGSYFCMKRNIPEFGSPYVEVELQDAWENILTGLMADFENIQATGGLMSSHPIRPSDKAP